MSWTPGIYRRMIAQAPAMYEALVAMLANCRSTGDCSDGALQEGEYCSDECVAAARIISAVKGKG